MLLVSVCHGESVPGLVTIDDFITDQSIAEQYFQELQRRFKNGKFDQELFTYQSDIRGPRLSRTDYENIRVTLQRLITLYPWERKRIKETPYLSTVRISDGGTETLVVDPKWEKIGRKLADIQESLSLSKIISEYAEDSRSKITKELSDAIGVSENSLVREFNLDQTEHQEALTKVLTKQFNRQRSPAAARHLADLLLVFEAGDRIGKLANGDFTGEIQYQVYEDIERSAKKRGRELGVPGFVTDDLATHSSMRLGTRTKFFRDGLVITPMTRFEALFKGVGSGECVRASCFRYFDALLEDSFHLKILQKGKETGYIGVYKTIDEKGRKIWFLETIQAPFRGRSEAIRPIVAFLQQQALLDGALLAVPLESVNSYNYNEVTEAMMRIPEALTRHHATAKFYHSTILERVSKLADESSSLADKKLLKESGYGSGLLNGLAFTEGHVNIIAPLTDQPDWVLNASYDLLATGRTKIHRKIQLSTNQRARLGIATTDGPFIKALWYREYLALKEAGKNRKAKELREIIYEVIPTDLQTSGFDKQFDYVKKLMGSASLKPSLVQKLKDELSLKAESWAQYSNILSLPRRDERMTTFLITTLPKFGEMASESDLVEVFNQQFHNMAGAAEDMALFRIIADKLTSSTKFIELIVFADGGAQGGPTFQEESLLEEYIVENWERFLKPDTTWANRLHWANKVLERVDEDPAGLKIRDSLFQRATEFDHILEVLKLSTLEESTALSALIAKAMLRVMKDRDLLELNLWGVDRLSLLKKHLQGEDFLRVGEELLGRTTNQDEFYEVIGSFDMTSRDFLRIASEAKNEEFRRLSLELLLEDPLDQDFFKVKEGNIDLALRNEKKRVALISHKFPNAPDRVLHELERVLTGSSLLHESDAKAMIYYINSIKDLDSDVQKVAYERMRKFRPYLLEVIPEHANFIEAYERWGERLRIHVHLSRNGFPGSHVDTTPGARYGAANPYRDFCSSLVNRLKAE